MILPNNPLVRFFLRFVLFISPVVVFLAVYIHLLYFTGESWPIPIVISEQNRRPDALFLRGLFDQCFYSYKYNGILNRQPKIMALGSSRTMKFRSDMFGAEGKNFYNAGGMIQCLDDLDSFSTLISPKIRPKMIFLGVDIWFFNDNYVVQEGLKKGIDVDGHVTWQDYLLGLRTLLLRHPSVVWAEMKRMALREKLPDFIGLQARMKRDGFRIDGSLKGGLKAPEKIEDWKFVDREQPPLKDRIRNGYARFELTNEMSFERKEKLKRILQTFKSQGVLVVGFTPPLSDEAAAMLDDDPRYERIWRSYVPDMKKMFEDMAFPFVDASRPSLLGLDDRYMIDGFHGEEMLHVHLLRMMLKDARVAALLPGVKKILNGAVASPRSNFWYPDFHAV